jgi:hypothetical protein
MRHILAAEPVEEGLNNSLLTFPEHQTLQTFLVLLTRLLKSGHGARVRNVVDSEVIGSIRAIMEDLVLFGGLIGQLACKMLAIIIHNEPTSYAALHESGLPQAFLKMVATHLPPCYELIQALPNVFDAICINAQGKELFSQYNFDGFFRIFQSLPHCKIMTKAHCSQDTGAGMDELLRHHPELKDVFLKSLIDMMKDVCETRASALAPTGPKLPVLEDMTVTKSEEETKWICKPNTDYNLTKARLEEERNVPVLMLGRNIFMVRTCKVTNVVFGRILLYTPLDQGVSRFGRSSSFTVVVERAFHAVRL